MKLFNSILQSAPFFVLLTQIKRERKKGAIIIGEETEKLVSRWAYIDYVLNKSHPELYSILAEADTRRMKHFCQSEIMDVYSKKELEELKVLFAENTYNSKYSGSSALVFNVPSNVVREANNRFPQEMQPYYDQMYLLTQKLNNYNLYRR